MNPSLHPDDLYNRKLVSNVHPENWTNPVPSGKYDLVVIGAGTAGLVTAAGAAGLGAKVALIERHFMGGDCLNVGCVPSKAIIAAAHTVASLQTAGEMGVNIPQGTEVDFGAVMERMRRLRSDISPHDSVERFAGLGIDVFLGQGHFIDRSTVAVDDVKLNFSKAVICTGARAAAPPISGLESISYLTNENLFNLTELPRRFGIVGAGPIGCEMAQAFARLGSEVYLVDSGSQILGKEDPDAAKILRDQLVKDGVQILPNGKDLCLSMDGEVILMQGKSDSGNYSQRVDKLLIAVGRAPNVEELDLQKAGVDFTDKGVSIDDQFRTTNKRIFAAGDICSKYQFTHAADFMARAVIRNALFFGRAKLSNLIIPWCTFTSPELAHVGLNPTIAREKGIEIDTYTQALSGVDRAILEGDIEGFVRIHVKKGGDEILGATIIAKNAGDMISTISVAMTNSLGLGKIANTIFPYPTQAEGIRKVGDQYSKTRLTPFVAGLLKKLIAWQR